VTATAISEDGRRAVLVSRGMRLNWLTLAYNSLEGVIAISAGLLAGSVALVGFGFDSVIEVTASGAAQWRLRSDIVPLRRERVERISLRLIGASFLALALYVAYDSIASLWTRARPDTSWLGIALAIASLIVMPLLARAKRQVASGLRSSALTADARQTTLCAYLSAILLGGLALNAMFGWWWADPIAALIMVPIIAHEGIEGVRGRTIGCDDGCAM
jgi:divalent metal cation (Fe/Co/Zn/Cd) transporter